MTINEEKELRQIIKRVVSEQLQENLEAEAKKHSNHKKKKKHKDNNKNKRAIVLKWLKDPSVNCAEIMRKLWKPGDQDEEDAARSYFYKCRDGKLNDSGEPYKFTDQDINKLYSLKSSSSL